MKERRETEKHDDKGREVRDISATAEEEGYVERREGRVRARRVDVGRTRTRRTRPRQRGRERREERSEEGGEERSKGLRRKEKGTRKEGGERDEAKQRRIEAGCCAVTVH